ncbi:hypothetical protein DYB32_008738 [Aphanomyces invadans]|uniref:Protein kinase domain-containing protein n=1 Tax=Aphanomyces invadans TaxID=157072 RepID=A0A3R6Y2N5_9STRA|nr:hypothetical protein DYB32_008738 [Aphanomyces invadans]
MGATSTHVKLCYNASNKTSLTLPCVKSVAEPFTTAASTTAPTSAAVANGSSSVGVILGGVVGGLVALGLALFFFRRRRAAASSSQRQCDVSAYIPPQPTAARSATAPSPTPRAPPSAELDYTNVRHLRQYLSTHPKLESMWMADVVSPIKTTALKGAESTHVTTMVGTKKVVLKGMPYMDVSPQIRQAFVEGLLTLHGKSLRHRHLTTLLGMTLVDSNGHTLLCGATEYMDHGSIGAVLLDAKTQLDPHQQTTIAIAIAEAIEFLHRQHGLAFGLVAPDKILVDGSLHTVKLNVLTLLVPFYDGIRTTNLLSNAGSTLHIPFVAPELRRRDTSPTAASDVYALAVMIGFIFTRKLPFSTVYHDKGLVRGDLHLVQHPKTMPYAAEVIPESFRALWKSALDVDPARRPTASHLLLALNELPH